MRIKRRNLGDAAPSFDVAYLFLSPLFPVFRDRFARFPERFPDGLGKKVSPPRLLSTLSFVSERMGTKKRTLNAKNTNFLSGLRMIFVHGKLFEI